MTKALSSGCRKSTRMRWSGLRSWIIVCGAHSETRDEERGVVKMGSLVTGCDSSATAAGSYTSSAGCGLHAHTHQNAPPHRCCAGHSLSGLGRFVQSIHTSTTMTLIHMYQTPPTRQIPPELKKSAPSKNSQVHESTVFSNFGKFDRF
jgi:hypothetical protein